MRIIFISIQYSIDFHLCWEIIFLLICSSEYNKYYGCMNFQIYSSALSVDSKNRC